jgi:hypothetical protein
VTKEVWELYAALVTPTTVYNDAKAAYEKLRARLIAELGYDAFRDIQREAFKLIGMVWG